MPDAIDINAKKIYDYMKLNMPVEKCDAILALGSSDVRVATRAAQLMLMGYGKYLVICGGQGKITKDLNDKAEAEIFREVALKMGVPDVEILIETKSTNTGENIQFTEELLHERNINVKSLLVVTKTFIERRVYATFKRQWSDKKTKIIITSPQIAYEDYPTENVSKELFINLMVGDLQRIKEFPRLGYQVPQDIPSDVWQAYQLLVAAGYNEQLLKYVAP